MTKNKLIKVITVVVFLAALAAALYCFGRIKKEPMVSTTGYSYEKAVVTEIVRDNLMEDNIRLGSQYLKIKLLSGKYKGQIIDATSSDGSLFGAVCKVGDKVIVSLSVSGNTANAAVYSKDRTMAVVGFVAIFLILICIIGGKNGIKSVVGLAFTFFAVVFLLLPMIYTGISPFLAAVIIAVLTTVVTMILIGGFTKKTVSAIAGTTMGVLIAGISAWLFGKTADIDGFNVSNIETLIYVAQNTKVKVGELLFAGILIAALGAVMDVAMSVSSAICEINDKSPNLTLKELFKSGMNVGRDMMGTMSNTLILAFAGSSLSTLVLNYVYDLPARQIINSYSMGIEIMQGMAGSLGVILTVPSVAFITSVLIKKSGSHIPEKSL